MKTFLKRLFVNFTPKTSSFLLKNNKFYFSENQINEAQTISTNEENKNQSIKENPNTNKEKKQNKKQQNDKDQNIDQNKDNISTKDNTNHLKEEEKKDVNAQANSINNQQEKKSEKKNEEKGKKIKQDIKAENKNENSQHKEEIKSSNPLISEKYKKAVETFKANFKNIAIENEEKKLEEMQKEMSASQIEYLQLLANKFMSFNPYQMKYFNHVFSDKVIQKTGLSVLDIHTDFNSMYQSETIQHVNPGYFRQQEQMSQFTSWLKTKAEPKNIAENTGPKEEVVEVKKEEKKEKEVYDIELTSFDAAKKIVLIKEVRAALNLGLKEAKELVEKAPVVIFKSVKKADCEAKIAKLKENGGVLKMI